MIGAERPPSEAERLCVLDSNLELSVERVYEVQRTLATRYEDNPTATAASPTPTAAAA
jgi:hypothetical protein